MALDSDIEYVYDDSAYLSMSESMQGRLVADTFTPNNMKYGEALRAMDDGTFDLVSIDTYYVFRQSTPYWRPRWILFYHEIEPEEAAAWIYNLPKWANIDIEAVYELGLLPDEDDYD